MCDEKQTSSNGGDQLEVDEHNRPYDNSVTAWLIYQAVHFLNTTDKEGERAYTQVAELLHRCGDDLLETVTGMFWQAKSGDTPLRWSLLYVLGDAGDENVADFLVKTALAQLPEPNDDLCCEGPRDSEMLICTMAVHALQSVARRHPEVSERFLEIVAERPARPILIEAVKVAIDLDLKEKVQEVLADEDHWILDIRRARTEELFAEPEREDGNERGFTPPKMGLAYTAPQITTLTRKEE